MQDLPDLLEDSDDEDEDELDANTTVEDPKKKAVLKLVPPVTSLELPTGVREASTKYNKVMAPAQIRAVHAYSCCRKNCCKKFDLGEICQERHNFHSLKEEHSKLLLHQLVTPRHGKCFRYHIGGKVSVPPLAGWLTDPWCRRYAGRHSKRSWAYRTTN